MYPYGEWSAVGYVKPGAFNAEENWYHVKYLEKVCKQYCGLH
jgi:hypothetical protein